MSSSTEIQACRERLLALRARLSGDQSMLKEDVLRAGGGEMSGGLSDVPLHLADLGSHESEEEINITLLRNEEQLLGEVVDALNRLDRGTFGQCEGCRKEIPADRLRAIPYARLCIRCARRLDVAAP